MRRLPLVILMVGLLVVMVTGCHRAPRYDSRLVAADSLMRDNPDSALAIVSAVNIDSLTDEGDHAYRDLLLTQARYKCYIVATTDSDINRALNYYRRHDNEREKLTRAYIYKGTVMEELGHPDSAMLYYKQAEAAAAPTDYFNLGYCNMRIGKLYQSYYANEQKTVVRMRKAQQYFEAIADTNYLILVIGTQGLFPKIVGKDSARCFLEEAVSLAKTINSSKRFTYQSKLAGFLFYHDNDYRRVIDLSLDIINNDRKGYCDENQFNYYAAWSYLKLGLLDSAYWIKSIIPHPENAVDSMNYFQLQADLSSASHHYNDYRHYIAEAKLLQSQILNDSKNSKVEIAEIMWDADSKESNYKKETTFRWLGILSTILILVLASVYAATMVVKKRILKYQNELLTTRQELENIMVSYEQEQQQLKREIKEHRTIIKTKERALKEKNNQFKKL